jgi:hypothetical protein
VEGKRRRREQEEELELDEGSRGGREEYGRLGWRVVRSGARRVVVETG